ncbi:hypothetical protein JCM15765_18780 [Paradesulfitobacterium aromaticivorans]
MQNPKAQASAHYLVTKAVQIYQLVKDEDTAWHAGIVNKPNWSLYDGTNPNKYTIGIKHEGQPGDVFTEVQYQAILWLHKELIRKWGIPIDSDHIIGHYRIDSVNRPNCPGSGFPWERLFRDLKGSDTVDEGILIFGPDDFVTANRLAATLGNEVAGLSLVLQRQRRIKCIVLYDCCHDYSKISGRHHRQSYAVI